jgi:SAM-dependent methyltransferase
MVEDAVSNWRDRGALFDVASDDYTDGRPGYPDELFQILVVRCGLGQGTSVLEVGPGTGQASLPILRTGARMTLVDPGRALAERLVRRTVGMDVRIIVDTFEDAELPRDAFDIVVSATAFHWVNPDVGYRKCASVLREGGWLALWWNVYGDDDRPDPFHDALQAVLEAKAPHLVGEGGAAMSYALDDRARTAEIRHTASFGSVDQHVIRWEGHHQPEDLRRMFATFSPWLALRDDVRHDLLDDVSTLARDQFSGLVIRPYQTVLYLAQRLART